MPEWTWEWTGCDPGTERLRESLCTLGNGSFATRGALPEHRAGPVHCPGTYAAGCYKRLGSTVAGRQVVNEDLVNLPNRLPLRFRLRRAEAAWGPRFSSGTHTLSYLRRTSHGSTLSGLVHGLVLARAGRAEAWSYVREVLEADIADIQGGTTGEDIHLGAMAGALSLVQRGLTGLETREDALWLDPVPLPALSEYGFTMRCRGHRGVGVRRRSGLLEIIVPDSEESPVRVMPADRAVTIAPGETCSPVLPSASSG